MRLKVFLVGALLLSFVPTYGGHREDAYRAKLYERLWVVCDENYDPRLEQYGECQAVLSEIDEAYKKKAKSGENGANLQQ